MRCSAGQHPAADVLDQCSSSVYLLHYPGDQVRQTGVPWISIFLLSSMSFLQGRWQALKLTRRQKAIGLTVASLCIWASAGWTARLQVLLLGALTVRCNLKPAEVTNLF